MTNIWGFFARDWCIRTHNIETEKIEKIMSDQLKQVKQTISKSKGVPTFKEAIFDRTNDDDDW